MGHLILISSDSSGDGFCSDTVKLRPNQNHLPSNSQWGKSVQIKQFYFKSSIPLLSLGCLLSLSLTSGCSTFSRKSDSEHPPEILPEPSPKVSETMAPPKAIEVSEKDRIFNSIDMRLQILEAKLSSLNDKLDATRMGLDTLTSNMKKREVAAIPPPADSFGATPKVVAAPSDPEAGFAEDDSIEDFRKAMILYHGQKYPESILAFSQFMQNYPDHPLAGSAQFYVAQSYELQKEYRLAQKEYQQMILSYEESPHISEAIRNIATLSERLQDIQTAAKYRQILSSVFPSSPAASQPMMTNPQTHEARNHEGEQSAPSISQASLPSESNPSLPQTAPIGTHSEETHSP